MRAAADTLPARERISRKASWRAAVQPSLGVGRICCIDELKAIVDRNLIRAAVAEMIGYPNTPAAIIINESLEIGRRYAAPESIHFLNGVLDAIARDLLKKRLA